MCSTTNTPRQSRLTITEMVYDTQGDLIDIRWRIDGDDAAGTSIWEDLEGTQEDWNTAIRDSLAYEGVTAGDLREGATFDADFEVISGDCDVTLHRVSQASASA